MITSLIPFVPALSGLKKKNSLPCKLWNPLPLFFHNITERTIRTNSFGFP